MERKKAVHHPAAERECHRLKAFPARRAEVHPGAGPVKKCLPCTAGFVLRSLRAASAEGMGHSILLNRSGTAVLPSSEYRRRWGLFYTIGNFISYRIKTSGGSHCGRMEEYGADWQYQRRDPHHKGAGSGDPFLAGGISVSQL